MPREPRPDDLARAAAGESTEPQYMEAHIVGTLKYWRDAKDYGAISSDATAPWDIWCHFSGVEMESFKVLVPGERVTVHHYRADQESFR
jgi:cold shock CspA family protein